MFEGELMSINGCFGLLVLRVVLLLLLFMFRLRFCLRERYDDELILVLLVFESFTVSS